ncbi:HemK2/MTQ2 family protein methyltransferase [Actinokineospora bangkokensis]|uniref:Methyltransferase n=1 Tax=Actinokineospora bangkokensis TaxID=1193682 RepID=A0A1Q9LN02_9PSEU|nr:HemK2/MTQ2 family protein methyltransferase [Actinokineospora bangkokensis]OLR93395.1 methyltransferase [Actinokineospora bangkokensis]
MTELARVPVLGTGAPLPRVVRLPGVYRTQEDTAFLASVALAEPLPAGTRVLDVCTGTGALAVAAARAGAEHVLAVDIGRRAVWTTRLNARRHRVPVTARRVSALDLVPERGFDLVLANPPYVPCAEPGVPSGCDRAWDAGPLGRDLVDPLCDAMPALLSDRGVMMMVHSEVTGVDATLDRLRAHGLTAEVAARTTIPFGPVMRERADFLAAVGLIEPGQSTEDLVVVRATR